MVFDIYSWDKRVIVERINLAMDRISLIRAEEDIKFKDFFAELASFLEKVNDIRLKKESGEFEALSFEELKDMQDELFYDLREDIYAGSVYNPDVLEKLFDKDFVSPLLSLGFEVRAALVSVYEGDLEGFVNILELFLQVYGIAMEDGSAKEIADAIYWYASDYLDVTARKRIIESFTTSNRFFYNIIMNDDLSDLRYLFKFGEYIGSNEINTAKYLNSLDNETVRLCAKTFVDGYRDGFFAMQKDISKRSVVSLIYNIGFERIVKEAVIFFEDMGFEVVLQRKPYRLADISPVKNRGICSGGVNRQFEYDHKFDMNIFTKKAYLDRKLEVSRQTFEEIKEDMSKYGGPARMESFGEIEFLPVKKKCANAFGEKQNNLMTNYRNEMMLLQDEYIDTSGTAFCIIAWPLPSIAEDEKIYSNIFDDIIRINTLDATKYKDAQQKIIDALDKADTVSIVGGEGNKTSLTIKLHELKDATKETNFENCVADVNIPVGEVFTSPVLKGTEGTLFVKDVFLSGYHLKNLCIKVKDGMIEDYTCENFESEEDNKRIIDDAVLKGHKSLPMGEFAIGTNVIAYNVAKKYDIFEKMPILIAEKMGPHFAFGDTCYSHEEDNITYNPDGKAITARDNECSIIRKTDIKKAYFNCHTDITIPLAELGDIYTNEPDGAHTYIIRDGKFVLEGSEILNE